MTRLTTTKIRIIFTVLLLVTLACTCGNPAQFFNPTAESLPPEPLPAQDQPTLSPANAQPPDIPASSVYAPPFAAYPPVAARLPQVYAGPDYSLPLDLAQVSRLEDAALSGEQMALLAANGFAVARPKPGEFREFYQIYESLRYGEENIFITTDAMFHVYHLIFDKMLRDLEQASFIPTLEELTRSLLKTSADQYQALKDTALEDAALRNMAYFSVAAQLLELPDSLPVEAAPLAEAEINLIRGQAGVATSPIWQRPDMGSSEELIEDYSQFIPRGHYTRNDNLKRYFRAMMWYGRLTFRLKDTFETQRALLVVQALRQAVSADGEPAAALWQRIYEPTAFIVGKADDLSYSEYGAISDAVFGANPDLKAFADEQLMAQFLEAAKTLPAPQVNSMWVWIWEDRDEATQGFRFMGQRFTLDAYIFGQVMWRKVGTLDNPRDLPKGLDVFAAMGSEEARQILKELGEDNYENYAVQMDKVTREVASLEQDSWTQNLYWGWLYALQPLASAKGETYPTFMRTQAWTRKDLQTALGSWTELKHDTLLYAKQVMAEMGGGMEEEAPPHGYVEPNPEAFARLYALSKMTYDGLQARNLLDPNTQGNLENIMDLCQFLQSAAERQLAGEALTDEEYWRIKFFGGELEALTLAAADKETEDYSSRDLSDQQAALVADVATGVGRVLEEAIGQPTYIYIVLPGEPVRLGIGAVYTYYEFVVPPEERMTDETWQAKVASGETPPQPEWTNSFAAP